MDLKVFPDLLHLSHFFREKECWSGVRFFDELLLLFIINMRIYILAGDVLT
jgi:hypothetical protein